jgi:iron(III) transport system substrate-binding protein
MRRIGTFLAATLALAGAAHAQPSGKLVLYTSQPEGDAQMTVAAFKKAVPGVEVEWTRNGTTQLMNVLRAEIAAGDPRPDVLLVADTINLGQLKREGRLMPYKEANVAGYDPALLDVDRAWFGTKLLATGIVFHTRAPARPTAWADLTKADAKGLAVMASPLYSGAALVHLHTLIQSPALGWRHFEDLKANGVVPQGGNGPVMKAVAGGQALYGAVVDFLAIRARKDGSPVDFVFPADGVSVVTEPVAIMSTARNVPAAKAFVDFTLSRAGQELVTQMGYLPAHPAVAPPEGFPATSTVKILPLDVERAIAENEAVMKRFTELFGG